MDRDDVKTVKESTSCNEMLEAGGGEKMSLQLEFTICSRPPKPITPEQQQTTLSDKIMSAKNNNTGSVPYKCVLCQIEIPDRSEIGAHLKACRLVHGGLCMTENGPQPIGSRVSLFSVVSLFSTNSSSCCVCQSGPFRRLTWMCMLFYDVHT